MEVNINHIIIILLRAGVVFVIVCSVLMLCLNELLHLCCNKKKVRLQGWGKAVILKLGGRPPCGGLKPLQGGA